MYKEHMRVDFPVPVGPKKNGHEKFKSTNKNVLKVKKYAIKVT